MCACISRGRHRIVADAVAPVRRAATLRYSIVAVAAEHQAPFTRTGVRPLRALRQCTVAAALIPMLHSLSAQWRRGPSVPRK